MTETLKGFKTGEEVQKQKPKVTRRHFTLSVPFVVAPFQNSKIEESFEMVDENGISQSDWDHEVENFKNQLIYKAKSVRRQLRKELEE